MKTKSTTFNLRSYKMIAFILFVIVLLTTTQLLSANSTVFNLDNLDSKVTKVEYKIGDNPYSSVDLSSPQIELPQNINPDEKLIIKLYSKEISLGEQFIYRYDDKLNTWIYVEALGVAPKKIELTLSPYLTFMFTDKKLNYMYSFPFGLGVDLSASFPFSKDLIFNFDVELQYVSSNNIWAQSFLIYNFDLGAGYRFALGDKFFLTPSASYGISLHHFIEGLEGNSVYLSHILAVNLKAGYLINSKMNVFLEPNVKFMMDSSGNGFLYSLRGGVGFEL